MDPSVRRVPLLLRLTLVTMYTFRGLTQTRFLALLRALIPCEQVLQVCMNYLLL